MKTVTLLLFLLILFGCVLTGLPLLPALVSGYVLFAVYALISGFSFNDVVRMSFKGIKTTKNILITFLLIGTVTALWRAGGTIPAIVCYSAQIMNSSVFVFLTFILNCGISFLTGTAFGTAATMGVICMTMSEPLGINPVAMGGAVLGGAYFGDRCSPVSTSALLVAELTGTNIYDNIKNMLKTAAVPFLISCAAYLAYGIISPVADNEILDIGTLFSKEFSITPMAVIPAVLIIVLALFRVNVKISMLASAVCSVFICLFCQGTSAYEIFRSCILGFTAENAELSDLINGGGIVSMLNVTAIVCISSCYSGIFGETGLLDPVQKLVEKMRTRFSAYTVIFITAAFSAMTACNQTLSIMLTNQLCGKIENDRSKLAIYLENSAVVIAPLVPWSIAGNVALASAGAPMPSIIAAAFLYILPVYSLIVFRKKYK